MPTLSNCVSPQVRWELAIRTIPPARLARTFATELGSFYDRGEFDLLARRVRDLYDSRDPEQGWAFRAHLDRRLYDRYHTPVVWDVSPATSPLPPLPSPESIVCESSCDLRTGLHYRPFLPDTNGGS